MSNQIYSNDTNKYYEWNGLNTYSATQATAVGLVLKTINFGTSGISQIPNLVEFDGTGVMTILQSGMYSLSYMIIVIGEDPDGTDLEFFASITMTRPGQFSDIYLSQSENRYVARQADPGDTTGTRRLTLNFTGYLNAADRIVPHIYNYVTGADSGVVIQSSSTLIINKIY